MRVLEDTGRDERKKCLIGSARDKEVTVSLTVCVFNLVHFWFGSPMALEFIALYFNLVLLMFLLLLPPPLLCIKILVVKRIYRIFEYSVLTKYSNTKSATRTNLRTLHPYTDIICIDVNDSSIYMYNVHSMHAVAPIEVLVIYLYIVYFVVPAAQTRRVKTGTEGIALWRTTEAKPNCTQFLVESTTLNSKMLCSRASDNLHLHWIFY